MSENAMLQMSLNSSMPWTTNDPRALEPALNALFIQADYSNRRWAQKWFETFQFVLGNQYLKWSRQYDFAVDTDLLRNGAESQKRSQTNISRTALESLAAMIYSQLGDVFCEAKYDSTSRGLRLAKTIESLIECYNERLNLHEEFDFGSVLYTMYSKVYADVRWAKHLGPTFQRTKQQLAQVPKMTTRAEMDPITGETVTVPVPLLGPDGQPVMINTWVDVLGPDGKPVKEFVTTGDATIDMCSPFEVLSDNMAKTFSKAKWVERIKVMDYDDFMVEYADEEGAIPEAMDRIRGGAVSQPIRNTAIRHFLRTMFAVPPVLDFNGQLNLSNMLMLKNKVLVVEHFDRPTRGHRRNPTPWLAQGRRCVVANGRLCLISTPQYRMAGATGWHPLVEAKWLPLAPSSHSSGPMADTVQKNRELNLTDTMMTLAIQRQAGGAVIFNENAGIDKNKWTGEPGQTFYASGDPSNAVHFASDKNPLPALVHQYRDQVKNDVYEVSGAQDSLRGERTVGATSGYQARLVEERERKRTSKASNNWESFVRQIYMKLICCVQQNAVKLDDSVVSRMMRTTDGSISQSDIYAFLNGPIDFGVDVKIKPDSMTTKSKATKIADIFEALKLPGMVERFVQDPAVLDSLLDFLEIEVLRDVKSVHRDRAKRENAIFNDMSSVVDPERLAQIYNEDLPVPLWQDDDLVHLIEHTRDLVANYDKYKRNPALLKMHAIHCAAHEQNYKTKVGEQSPYLASQAPIMVQNAQQEAAQPKNLLQELYEFRAKKEEEARIAAQVASAQPTQRPAEGQQQQPPAAPAKGGE